MKYVSMTRSDKTFVLAHDDRMGFTIFDIAALVSWGSLLGISDLRDIFAAIVKIDHDDIEIEWGPLYAGLANGDDTEAAKVRARLGVTPGVGLALVADCFQVSDEDKAEIERLISESGANPSMSTDDIADAWMLGEMAGKVDRYTSENVETLAAMADEAMQIVNSGGQS